MCGLLLPDLPDDQSPLRQLLARTVGSSPDPMFFCIDTGAKAIETVPANMTPGCDFDVAGHSAVFTGMSESRPILKVTSLAGGFCRIYPVTHQYDTVRLCPDGKCVLLTSDQTTELDRIGVVVLATGAEHTLSTTGTCARWGPDHSIVYLDSKTRLMEVDPKTETKRVLVEFSDEANLGFNGRSEVPTLSRDRTLLAIGCSSSKGDAKAVRGTLLLDLNTHECRIVDGWWYNVTWAQ